MKKLVLVAGFVLWGALGVVSAQVQSSDITNVVSEVEKVAETVQAQLKGVEVRKKKAEDAVQAANEKIGKQQKIIDDILKEEKAQLETFKNDKKKIETELKALEAKKEACNITDLGDECKEGGGASPIDFEAQIKAKKEALEAKETAIKNQEKIIKNPASSSKINEEDKKKIAGAETEIKAQEEVRKNARTDLEAADKSIKKITLAELANQTATFKVGDFLSVGKEHELVLGGTNQETDLISRIISLLARIIGTIAILLLVISGFFMITSRGDENTLQKGKTIALYTVLGVALVFTAYLIVQFVLSIIFST